MTYLKTHRPVFLFANSNRQSPSPTFTSLAELRDRLSIDIIGAVCNVRTIMFWKKHGILCRLESFLMSISPLAIIKIGIMT